VTKAAKIASRNPTSSTRTVLWSLRFAAECVCKVDEMCSMEIVETMDDHFYGPQSTQTLADSLGSGGANASLNPLYQIGGPRSIQLALKLQF
jgi:hypothetical protein